MRTGRSIVALMLPLLLLACNDSKMMNMGARLNYLEKEIFVECQKNSQSIVSLESKNKLQRTNDRLFGVMILSVDEHLDGIKINGKILNLSSVGYLNHSFYIVAGDELNHILMDPDLRRDPPYDPHDWIGEAEFAVKSLPPAQTGDFSVYIPNVSIKIMPYALIRSGLGETILYGR